MKALVISLIIAYEKTIISTHKIAFVTAFLPAQVSLPVKILLA